MPNIVAAYQAKLRIFFFQGSIYFLLFAIVLTAVRLLLIGDWQSLIKILTYSVVVLILMRCLRILQQENMLTLPNDVRSEFPSVHSTVPTQRDEIPSVVSGRVQLAQKIGVTALLLASAIYIAITTHALFVLGVIMLATILFFSILSAGRHQAYEWLIVATALFLTALTARQVVPALRLDYSLDLLITLYLFPPFFFWLCVKIATNLLDQLTELLAVGQELAADLRQSELQYQELLQTMNEGFVVVDENDIFLYVNDKFCTIVGYEREELIGHCNETVLAYDDASLQILQEQTQIRRASLRSTYEVGTRNKDGTPIHLMISAVPRLDVHEKVCGAVCVVMDISERKAVEEALRLERERLSERVEERTASLRAATEALQQELQERKQAEAALRVAEEEYRALFDNVPLGIYRSSLDGRQLRANPALVTLNGYETEEEMVAAVTDIATEWYVDKTRRAEFQAELAARSQVRNFESEIYRHKSRERLWISETANLVRDNQGQPLYYQGTVQDITERKVNEEARERLIMQLANVARLKDEFLANMSHELRTPLNSVLGMTEALQDEIYGAINERQRKALGTVERSGRHLLALINDILDLAQIESGQVELIIDTVDVTAVCESAVHLIQPTAHIKSIALEYYHQPDVKVFLADGPRIKQVLTNLLSNAIKFTPREGRIGLEVSGCNGPNPTVTIVVWDTGVGIPEEAREHLFEPFVQVDSSLSRRYEGTGLGLALVKRITEMHGGTVAVESVVGKGSRFVIKLPWYLPGQTMEYSGHNKLWTGQAISERPLTVDAA